MTEYEAKLILDVRISRFDHAEDVNEALEVAKISLEKQTPKKPIKYGDTRQGLDNDGNSISKQEDCYECPTCESFLGYVSDCKDENYQDCYCRACGQAILWEESEMEIKEAIEILKTHNEKCSGCDKLCDDSCKPAVELAISALEKQIPKIPYTYGDGYADGYPVIDMYECPNCGETYEIECDHYDYCPKCGQHIDRSGLE